MATRHLLYAFLLAPLASVGAAACSSDVGTEPISLNGGTFTWDTGVSMSVEVSSVTPWGESKDWCGNGACGVTEANDLRVLLTYEVSVPDDYAGDFDAWRCPGELSVVNGNDDEAIRPFSEVGEGAETLDLDGVILPGASKFGIAGYAISKAYEDEEFILTSSCGTGDEFTSLADFAGLEGDELLQKMEEAKAENESRQVVKYKGRLAGSGANTTAKAEPDESQDERQSPEAVDSNLGLKTVLPDDGELTEVIGVKWNSGRSDLTDAQSNLSNELAKQILPGEIEGVSPPACAVSAIAAGTGLPIDLQESLIEHASAFRQPTSDIASDRLFLWGVDAYLLESGEAERFMETLADAETNCEEATVLSASGTSMPFGVLRSLDDASGPSGSAYVAYSDVSGVVLTEALDDVLYVHYLNASVDYFDQVAGLYNAKMDELASELGVQRQAVVIG